MLPRNHPDRIQIAFDDHRLVANPGLILPATLALRLGLPQLLRKHLDLGGAPGRANTGDKMMTLVPSALAGGDCIDDADVLRAGQPNVPANSRQPSPRAPLAVSYPAISLSTATVGRHRCPQKRLQTARQPPVYPNSSPDHRACNSLTPFRCPHAVHPCPSVDSGLPLYLPYGQPWRSLATTKGCPEGMPLWRGIGGHPPTFPALPELVEGPLPGRKGAGGMVEVLVLRLAHHERHHTERHRGGRVDLATTVLS